MQPNTNNSTATSPHLNQLDQSILEVETFLNQCGLSQYYDIFIEEGFDRPDSLLEITESDLIQMQVKRGHRRLLQRGIANCKGIPASVPLNITPMLDKDYSAPLQSNDTLDIPMSLLNNNNNNNNSITTTTAANTPNSNSTNHASPIPSITTTTSSSSSSSLSTLNSNHKKLIPTTASIATLNNNDNNNFPSAGTMTSQQNGIVSSTEEEPVTNENVHKLWKRKYQRHAKPDPNAPLKPSSAYVMFSNDVRAELKEQNKSFTDLAKIIGDRWKNILPKDKEYYEIHALKAREDYLKKIEAYQKTDAYKQYQKYLANFKAENEASVARPVGRPRKRSKKEDDGSDASDSTHTKSSKDNPIHFIY